MHNDISSMYTQMATMNEQALAAVAEFNRITTRTQSLLARKHLAALETCLETGTAQLKLVGESHDPGELMERQVQMAASFGEKIVAVAQESLEIQVEARDELARWFENGFKSVQAVAEKAPAARAPRRPAARRTRRSTNKAA